MKIIDARGLSCPEPVILTRKALSSNENACQILVDNPVAKENITRYASSQGYQIVVTEEDGTYTLGITK